MRELLPGEDRCDRCGAQAFVIAEKVNRSELLFCQHHGREFRKALIEKGWIVNDQAEQQFANA